MTRGQIVTFLSVLMNLILFSNIHSSFSQHSYADPQGEAIGTLEVEVNLKNPLVGHGKEQIIHFQVTDQKSDKPVSGAITSATVSYADGKTIKHLSVPTDASGRSSISWTIERDAPNGIYEVVYSVYQTGYVSESFEGSFNLVGQNADYSCSSSSYSPETALSVVPPTGQDVHQKNARSGESSNFNCGQNLVKAGVEDQEYEFGED
jgi:hypothetical protein